MKDAVREVVVERLQALQALATRLEMLLRGDDIPGMALARTALAVDHAVAELANHAAVLDRPPT